MSGKHSPFVLANSKLNQKYTYGQKRPKSPLLTKSKRPQRSNKYCKNLNTYKIFSMLKTPSYGYRPKKLRLKNLNELVEQLYSDRYEIEMQNIRACMNRIVEEEDVQKEIRNFNEYIYDFLKRRYNGSVKKAEETVLNILKTLEAYKKNNRHLKLFCDFLNEILSPEDISCFLLIRSLIEKELKISIYNKNTKKILDLDYIALTKKQTKRIIVNFLGEEKKSTVQKVLHKFIQEYQTSYQGDIVRIYDLMIFGVKEYKKLRENRNTVNSFSNRSYIDSCCYQTFSPFSKNQSIREIHSPRKTQIEEGEITLQTLNQNLFHTNKSSKYESSDDIDKTQTATFTKEAFNPHHTFNYQNKENFGQRNSHDKYKLQEQQKYQSGMEHTFNGERELSNYESEPEEAKDETFREGNLVVNNNLNDKSGVFQVDVQHQSVYSNYNAGEASMNKRYNTVENLSLICFTTLKNIIKEFVVDVMSQEEIESDYDQNVIEEISGIIYHKAKILLKAITKRNKDKWFKQLMIHEPNPEQADYIEQIMRKFEFILETYRNEGYVDRDRTQELSKFILSAPEMTNQISKLIAHIVASFEGVDEDESAFDAEETLREESSRSNVYQIDENDSIMKTGDKRQNFSTENSYYEGETERADTENQYHSYEGDDDEEEVHVVDIQSDRGENEDSMHGYGNYFNDYNIGESGYKMTREEQEIIDNMKLNHQ